MKKAFYPIVSLAVALSASAALANETTNETIQNFSKNGELIRAGEASFTSDQRLTGTATGFQALTFSDGKNLTFENTGLFLTENKNKTQVNHLIFTFTKDLVGGNKQNTISTTGDTTTAKLFSDDTTKKGKTLQFSGGTNGASIQNLEVQFNGGSNGAGYRAFKMDFSKVGSGKTAFRGNITVSGSGYTGGGANNWTAFKGNFAGDFVGNITLDNKTGSKSNSQNLATQLYNELTFTGNASLKGGKLTLKDGELHLSLANGTVDSIEILEDQNGGTRSPKLFLTITGNGSIGNINDQTKNPTQKTELDLQGSSTLSLQGNTTFATLKFQGANTIDLSKTTGTKANPAHRVLTINSLDTNAGNSLTFVSRVSQNGADKVIIDGKTGTGKQNYSIKVVANQDAKSNKSIIATVKKEGGNGIINLGKTAEIKQGTIKGSFNLATKETNKDGAQGAGYISYQLNGLVGQSGGVTDPNPDNNSTPSEAIYTGEQIAQTALTISTNLFIANFNSLNKRMGDLRDNANSQGVWVRLFNGSQTNSFGVNDIQSKYITVQGGYDYGFSLNESAKNYLGLALSYGYSSLSELDSEIGKSDLVEFALYNSYIQDSGWYNDTVAKFSYLMNQITLNNTELNNFAFLVSDEFGYRFKLGASKEWFIDPQLELSLAYINKGELKDQNVTTDVASMMILKNRLGSSFGYEFKNNKSTLKVYAGGFYEFDYFNSDISKWNGNILGYAVNGEVKNSLNGKMDHRFVLNLGMNAEIEKNTRFYFDFEKSFAGKITTDYKFNLGARYAFGENAEKSASDDANKAPLKLDDSKQTK